MAALFLVGCEGTKEVYKKVTGSAYKPTACPKLSILADAAELTRFKPGTGRDIIDTMVEGKITGVNVLCKYDLENDRSGYLEVSVVLHFEAELGPASTERKAPLSYFLAVVDLDKRVLKRNTFTYEANFRGSMAKAAYQDEPVQFILPLKPNEDGAIFEIYAGFQLSHEEVEYNRRKKNN